MAGPSHLLTQLQRQLERLDDEAFSTLASAGLLRRARKDLESQTPELAEGEDSVTVRLSGHQITLDARGPSHARCSCPAKTTCQHILAACLFLKDRVQAPAPAAPATPEQSETTLRTELMAISLETLTRYAGKPAVREALQSLETEDVAQFSFDKTILIRLVRPGIEFRYAGGGPESLICEFRGRSLKKLAATAILAFQKAHGITHALPTEAPKRETAAQARDEEVQELRVTLLNKADRLLRECIDVGLAHVSDTLTERLLSLATVAEGAKLHRLALALSRLSDHVDLILERHARADSGALLAEVARTYALVTALRDSRSWNRIELVGEARSAYEETATLDLYCAGAYPWQTASGYWGLTLLFWSTARGRWLTYSDARPSGTLGFSPVDAYRTAGPWSGCQSPAAIMGRRLELNHASANRFGRLSGASATTANVASAATAPPDFAGCAFRDWSELRAAARADLDGIGLVERNPHADYVVLYPRRFLTRSFEGTTQTMHLPIEDQQGDVLLLSLAYSTISAHAIERLDALQPQGDVAVVAQMQWSSGVLSARPLALLRAPGVPVVDNIFLDEPPVTSRTQALLGKLRATLSNLPRVGGSSENELHPMGPTERALGELNALLLGIAERGIAARASYAQDFARQLSRLHDFGLTLLDPSAQIDADVILRARYASQLAQECLARN